MQIFTEKTYGGLRLSAIVGNQRYSKQYIAYTVTEAKKLFREYVNAEVKKYKN